MPFSIDILPQAWRPVLDYLPPDHFDRWDEFVNDSTHPNDSTVFAALELVAPESVSVCIFGQDPYPRRESATGIAFYDGKVKSWSNPMPPSLRNLVKSILITMGLADAGTRAAELRSILKSFRGPEDFFHRSARNGVLWLNTALTFQSKDSVDTRRHANFWRPFIEACVRLAMEHSNGIVFVLWGGIAQRLSQMISDQAGDRRYEIVTACHPMLQKFHETQTFRDVSDALRRLDRDPIQFLVRAAPTSHVLSSFSPPKVARISE